MDTFADLVRHASFEDEPHRRIGETMKIFASSQVELPSEVLSVVASVGQYQEDWQKRARELRVLGWKFSIRRETLNNRVRSFYSLASFEPWPEGNVGVEIRRREKEKKQKPKVTSS